MVDSYRLIFAPEAFRDLNHIYAIIAKDSADNAARFIQRILTSIDLLKTAPHHTAPQRVAPANTALPTAAARTAPTHERVLLEPMRGALQQSGE